MIETKQYQKEFGEYIKAGRTARGMTQMQVADQAGISQKYYSNIETGTRNVDFALAVKICEVLNVDISKFIRSTF